MSWLLDIIIIAIIAFTVTMAVKKGFIRTVLSAGSFLIAVILTALLASPVSDALKETVVAKAVQESIEDTIAEEISESTDGIDGLFEGESKIFNSLAETSNLDVDYWEQEYKKNSEDIEKRIAEKIAEPIIDIIATVIAIIIIFILSQLLLSLLSGALDKIFRLPVLKTFNKGFGAILGVVLALIRVCLFCFAANILIEFGGIIGNDFLMSFSPDKTILFEFFSGINIFSFFF